MVIFKGGTSTLCTSGCHHHVGPRAQAISVKCPGRISMTRKVTSKHGTQKLDIMNLHGFFGSSLPNLFSAIALAHLSGSCSTSLILSKIILSTRCPPCKLEDFWPCARWENIKRKVEADELGSEGNSRY